MTIGPEHYRKCEHLYHTARCNEYFQPRLTVREREAEIRIPIRRDFHHAAHSVHGSLYFKCLDDSAFFAAQSLVEDFFVMTASFHLHLLRPIVEGELVATGKVVHAGAGRILADSILTDRDGKELARGNGTFMRSRVPLGPDVGYLLPP